MSDEISSEQRIQQRYVHNVVNVETMKVTRVVVKAPSNIYAPDFDNNVGVWEQYWLDGRKLFERKMAPQDL